MRATQSFAKLEAVRKSAALSTTAGKSGVKPNSVLDTYQNVTVLSPPSKRRERLQEQVDARPRTRTLDAEEVVVLKSESAKQRSGREVSEAENDQQLLLKEPIAFDVRFESARKTAGKTIPMRWPMDAVAAPAATTSVITAAPGAETAATTACAVDNEYDYDEDDFESYESDFESSCATQNGSMSDKSENAGSKSSSDSSISSEDEPGDKSKSASESAKAIQSEGESECEDLELTQFPSTVIRRDREHERKMDSGSYEMHTLSQQMPLAESATAAPCSQAVFDESLDTSSAGTNDRLDSGISSCTQTKRSACNARGYAVFYGGYVQFHKRPACTKRGVELMSKIQFDTLSFTLLDLKPISYDIFMQSFGRLNTAQTSTQTQEQRSATESQTDEYECRSIWTQHPPQYDLQAVQSALSWGGTNQNCCGDFPSSDEPAVLADVSNTYDASLQALSVIRADERSRMLAQQLRRLRKPIDCERLINFLQYVAPVMSRVLNANNGAKNVSITQSAGGNKRSVLSSISVGYRKLDTHFLNALHVVRIFANPRCNFLLTVHACRPGEDVYSLDFANLLMVWSTTDSSDRPLRMLSTWSEVCRAELWQDSVDVVVCGLLDGSIALWDLRETHSFCSKLDGHLTHFAATQSVVPSWGEKTFPRKLVDLGAVVDVKAFRTTARNSELVYVDAGHQSLQFTTLHDFGILTIWTLVETGSSYHITARSTAQRKSGDDEKIPSSTCDDSSPWARLKLIQSATCDLRVYLHGRILKARSKFDKTKELFQKNIYCDEVLRELNDDLTVLPEGQGLQGLRFTSMDVGCERIYVCTNRNFLLACSKTLKPEGIDKIRINQSRFLFQTAVRVLSNEDFLAVALSNGSVTILNCRSRHKEEAINENEYRQATATPASRIGSSELVGIGKSCAFQNIILNERRSNINTDVASHDVRPSSAAACDSMLSERKKPFELRIYDQQILMSGSVLHKNLVQSLELSGDGWKLFALSDGEVRVYDFSLDSEVSAEFVDGALGERREAEIICDIAVAGSSRSEQHLLLLSASNEVQLHSLKP